MRLTELWLVTPGEPLPSDGDDVRLLRTGLLFEDLTARGVHVDWWTAGFDHANRRHRTTELTTLPYGETGRIVMVPSPGYRRSVSLRRLWDHRVIARRFTAAARRESPPQVVYCSYPTIELSRAAVAFGLRTRTPVVLDIRDLWPDVLWDSLFSARDGAARAAALAPMKRAAAWAVTHAAAVIGITDEYVQWALDLAGRERGPLDVAIPVTYPGHQPLVGTQRQAASSFWRERGIDVERHWIACFLGTMGRQFDFAPVVAAARRLRDAHPQLRLVLCGGGDGLDGLRADAAGLDNVCLPGWVDGPPRRLLLDRARVGLAPYRPSENFLLNLPNKPIEYMANGLPVLYPIEGVLHRVCSEAEAGLRYAPVEGSGDLASVLMHLLADERSLERLSAHALRRFEEHHERDRVSEMVRQHARAVREAW